ncbi:MAG TPA: D-alanine--D-alanine ligase [Desulfobacteraceae bacterium]|nr:D-alanine--D-alanine ligase [Desulfobacteraceae bacterium]
MKKKTVALLSGGVSPEREVSLSSGDQVEAALDKNRYTVRRFDPAYDLGRLVAEAGAIDVALIILHGAYGEDGTVQGLLDLLDIPYQGSGVLGSAVAMNKVLSKERYRQAGIPVPAHRVARCGQTVATDRWLDQLGLPVVVKPASCGSSIGMRIVRRAADLAPALEAAFAHDHTVLVEAYVRGREITGAVIGNEALEALPLIEIIPSAGHDFFDYRAKYVAGETNEICPAPLEADVTAEAQRLALAAHRALCCDGYSRTDMILAEDGFFVLETNTIPGMTRTSLFPQAAAAAGMPFDRLLDRLIELGIERHRLRKRHGGERQGK